MDSSRAASPKARTVTITALLGVAAAAQLVVVLLTDEPLPTLVAVAPSTAIALVGLALLARFERRQKTIVRELGRVRMVDRDHEALGAALLSEMHQIRAYNSTIAEALRINNERWGVRRDETFADGYLAGARAARRSVVSGATVVRRRHRRRPPRAGA